MKFYCPACHKVVTRKAAGWVKSYCQAADRYVRLQPMSKKKKGKRY